MRTIAWAMFCLILGNAFVPVFAQPNKATAKMLEGTWTAIKAERDGKSAADVLGHRLFFTGNRFQIFSKDARVVYEGTFRADPASKPGVIDFEHTIGALKGKVWKGIYALDGDTLMICDNAANPDGRRPSAFEAKAASGYVFITFRRTQP